MSEADGDYEVGEIARAWLVKMRGDDASSLRAEFEAWLTAAPAHRAAYDRIARAMDGARHATDGTPVPVVGDRAGLDLAGRLVAGTTSGALWRAATRITTNKILRRPRRRA